MQLNEILEENTVKAISAKTNISEDNIDALVAADFDKIKRVKTMGFISILEREYNADLSAFKKQAIEYYENKVDENESVTIGLPLPEEKGGKSKWFMLIVFLLLVYAIWYAFTNLDKEKLTSMLPFSEEKLSEMIMPGKTNTAEESADVKALSIETANTEDNSVENNTINEKK